jgi:hypothetical protein
MHWGVRKKSGDGSVDAPARGKQRSDDSKTAGKSLKRSKKQGVGSLSNQELKALNERMNLEANYKQLNAKQKNGARKFAEDIMLQTGKELTKEFAKNTAKATISATGDAFATARLNSLKIPLDVMWGD